MSSFQVNGKIEVIYDAQQVSEKFRKRDFVLRVESGMYPEYPKFQLTQDRCGLPEQYGFKVGDSVKVSFNLRGKPFEKAGEKTYFNNLEAWRIDKAEATAETAPTPPPAKQSAPPPQRPVPVAELSPGTEDDLPF